jgi:hypothetical protein
MKSILLSIFTLVVFSYAGVSTIQAQDALEKTGATNKYEKHALDVANAQAVSTTVVINEIYGAGGCNTAGCSAVNRDYIELKNIGTGLASIGGWSVQYASATGTSWTVITIPAGTTLRPGDTYLIGGSTNGASGTGATPLPTPNISTTLAMSGTAGKVALVSNSTPISGTGCPITAPIVDYVGYGATANCSETAPATAPTATTSVGRVTNADTDTNGADFVPGTPTPQAALQPTAASATIEGRVLNSFGNGLSKITVTVTDSAGNSQQYLTGAFGYYVFDGLRTGETYIVSVRSKAYRFDPATRVVSLEQDLQNLDFTASPQE